MTQQFGNPLPIDWTPSSGIGSRIHPITGENAEHKGADIPTAIGTPVYAAADGVISRVWIEGDKNDDGIIGNDGYGQYIIIKHYDSNEIYLGESRYAHLTIGSAKFTEGQKVKAGETIAFSGNSGGSTGPHLHFEIRDANGNVTNPLEVTDRTPRTEKATEITNNFFSQFSSSLVSKISEIKDIISGFSQTKLGQFITDLFDTDSSGSPKPVTISGQNSSGVEGSYTIQSGDTLSKIASSFHTTVDKLIADNPWLTSGNRISSDGKHVILYPNEKLSLSTSEIKSSVKLENVTLKNSDGTDAGHFTNFFLDQVNNTFLTNTQLNNNWQSSGLNSLANSKLEFDFDSFAVQQITGTGSKNWDGTSTIDNSLFNLTINTDKLQGFASNNNELGQTGVVIGDADWQGNMSTINNDGIKNVLPGGILSDGYRPGNMELSQYANFNTQLQVDFSRLNNLSNQLNQANQNQSLTDISRLNLQLQNPLADLTNSFANSLSFLNIDPVVLDLNGDGVKLTSYNDSQVTFDVDNDGKQERTGWVSSQDGILVHDKNQDGKINNITETISEYYNPNDGSVADADGKYSKDGLAALKKLDSNHDGKFNNQDSKWNDLKVWVDASGDGVTDAGELKTLTEAGIKEINLNNIITATKERNEGNIILSKSTYTTTDGQTKQVAAVDFTTNPIGYEFNDVNLGKLATSEEGTKSLIISNQNGETVTASDQTAQNIFGNIGNDSIIGDDRDNWLSGSKGSDTQSNIETTVGSNGDDFLIGGAPDDVLAGSDGNDMVDGFFRQKNANSIFRKNEHQTKADFGRELSLNQNEVLMQTLSVKKKRTDFLVKSDEVLFKTDFVYLLKTEKEVFANENTKLKEWKLLQVFVLMISCFGFFVANAFASSGYQALFNNLSQPKTKIEEIKKDNIQKYTEKECLALTVDADNAEQNNVIKRVIKLKTVTQFNSLIKRNNLLAENKTNKVFLSFEFIEPRYMNYKCFWNVYATEHHPTHSLLWKSFLVEISDAGIYEEDQADGSYRIIK